MKSFKSPKVAVSRSVLASMALAAALYFPSGAAQASVPTVDAATVAGWVAQAGQWVEEAKKWAEDTAHFASSATHFAEVKAAYQKAEKQISEAKDKMNEYEAKMVNRMAKSAAADEITFDDIKNIVFDQKKELSANAKKYFGSANVCKISESLGEAIAGKPGEFLTYAVKQEAPPKIRLEYNCVAQRELEYMSMQENLNHAKNMMGWAEELRKAGLPDKSNLEAFEAYKANEAKISENAKLETEVHNAKLSYIDAQQKILARNQRDIEVVMLQGTKRSGSIMSDTVKTAVIHNIMSKRVQAVNGYRTVATNGYESKQTINTYE